MVGQVADLPKIMPNDIDLLRYPVGRYDYQGTPTEADRGAWIAEIASAPGRLRAAVEGLTDQQLDTPYRPGGWTVRQVVHHLPDSHMNMYVRVRLALTEDEPQIKPYREECWAELPDARTGPVDVSLRLLEALHERLVALFQTLGPADWQRAFLHPERGRMTLDSTLPMYAWHCRHHIAHIKNLRWQ